VRQQAGNYGGRMNLRAHSDATVSVRIDNHNALAASYIPQPVLIIFEALLARILVQEGKMFSKSHKKAKLISVTYKNVIFIFLLYFVQLTNKFIIN